MRQIVKMYNAGTKRSVSVTLTVSLVIFIANARSSLRNM